MVERYSKSIARRQLGTLPKVTPKDAKVNNYEAQAWGQVAQTGAALYTQFGQYARDNARTQAIDDAEGVTLEKDSTGLTIMPPPMQEGGSIYQENYKKVIANVYKREIKTDIESRLSTIFAENFLNPVEMGELLDNSLGSIVENIAPQYQQEMGTAGQKMITTYKQRSTQEATRRTYNANIAGLKEESANITQLLVYNKLTDEERIANVARAVEIDLDLAEAGVLSPNEIKLRENSRAYYENYFNLKDLLEVRGPGESATLINNPNKYIEIAQLLEGNEGGANNVGVTLTDGLKDYEFTRESIEDLIADPVLRRKIATHFRQRANDLIEKTAVTKYDAGVLKQLDFWLKDNNTGRSRSSSMTDAMVEGAHEKAITSIFDDKYKGKFKVESISQDLAKVETPEAVEVMSGLIQWIGKTEDFPEFLLNEIKNINMASGAELANFHFPFYQQMKGTDELREIWDENVDVNTQRYFQRLELLVEGSSNPRNNKITFEEAANLMKVSNNEPIIAKISSMISTNLRENDESYAKGMSLEGSNKGLMLRYIDKFSNSGGLGLNSTMQYDKEMQAQLYRHALKYISSNFKHDLEDLNEDLVKVAKRVMDSRTDPEQMTGSYSKEKFESLLYTNNLSKIVNTPFNIAIETQANSAPAFNGKKEHAVLNNLVTTQIQAAINSQEYGLVNIEVLNDPYNTKTPAEMRNKNAVLSNQNQFRINPNANQKVKGETVSQGFAIDGPLDVSRKMYQPFTLDYKSKEMIMIYGKTYKLHYDDNSQEIYVVLIDDEGDFKTINGFLEVEDEQGNSKPLAINVDSYLAQNARDAQQIEELKALQEIEKNLDIDIEKNNVLKDGIVVKKDYKSSSPVLVEGALPFLWSKVKELYGYTTNYEVEGEVLNNLKRDNQEAQTVIKDEVKYEAEIDVKLKTNDEIRKDPVRSRLIKHNGKGKELTMDVSSLVAKMLPSDNEENVANYLFEISNVESDAGTNPDTYVGKNKDMGIWQNYKALTNIQYLIKANKKGQFADNIETIQKAMQDYAPGFTVANLKKEHLKNPLISAVIARLYIGLTEEPVPDTKVLRSKYWKKYYNTEEGKGTPENYISKNSVLMIE